MANKTSQEKRPVRLELTNANQELTTGSGLVLNTPDLDKACEMALPTPVLNKKVLDMYQKVEPVAPPQMSPPVVATADVHPPQPPVATTAAVKPFQAAPQSYQQPIIIVNIPTSANRVAVSSTSHSRIAQPSSSTNVVHAPLPMAPLDPMEQERLKVDRKRERNRAAAQRCREKKIKRIDDLSKEVDELEQQKTALVEELRLLEQSTDQTLQAVKEHQAAGCEIDNSEINKLVSDAEELGKVINNHLANLTTRQSFISTNDASSTSNE